MIFDAIIGLVVGILTGFLALLPSFELPGSLSNFGAGLGGMVAGVNGVFPIVTLGACIAAILGAHLFSALFKLVTWLYEHIPFKSS